MLVSWSRRSLMLAGGRPGRGQHSQVLPDQLFPFGGRLGHGVAGNVGGYRRQILTAGYGVAVTVAQRERVGACGESQAVAACPRLRVFDRRVGLIRHCCAAASSSSAASRIIAANRRAWPAGVNGSR